MTALRSIVEWVASLTVVATGRGGRLAHFLLTVGLKVDLFHSGGLVAQWLRDGGQRVFLEDRRIP